jgi:hypothetical protein
VEDAGATRAVDVLYDDGLAEVDGLAALRASRLMESAAVDPHSSPSPFWTA